MFRRPLLFVTALIASITFAACVGDDAPPSTGPSNDGGPSEDGTTPPTGDAAPGDGASQDGNTSSASAVDVAVGREFACAALTDGAVACWGKNDVGQAGQPAAGDAQCTGVACRPPTRVAGLADIVAVGAGAVSACAVARGGAVSCWGQNDSGQLGHANTNDPMCGNVRCSPQPTVVPGVDAVAVTVGTASACALLKTGAVACWGQNATGQLGRGTFAAGSFPPGEVNGLPEPATAVTMDAFGSGHVCALGKSGQVYCWGRNSAKEVADSPLQSLCNANTEYCIPTPTRVMVQQAPLDGVTAIAATDGATCVGRSNGTVVCWGYEGHAMFDATGGSSLPPTVKTTGAGLAKLSGNFAHVCGVDGQGVVKCWGDNGRGGLGVAPAVSADTCGSSKCSTKPVTIAGVAAKRVVAGTDATFVLTPSGEIFGWGSSRYGTLGQPPQVGDNQCATPCSPTPRKIELPN